MILIVLPFIVLAIAIMVIRFLRSIRNVGELQSRRVALTLPSTHRKPSDEFHDDVWLPLCRRVADLASVKLNRPLTIIERRTLWRCRTALVLEVALKEMEGFTRPEDVLALLSHLPPGMDRPDPTGFCRA